MGADLTAAAGGDMDQVTPALPQARAPQTDPTCSDPWIPAVLVLGRRERPGAAELGCSQRRNCTFQPNCSSWQGGSRERAGSGLRGMESWWGIKGSISRPRRCLQGHTHTEQGPWGKTTCEGDFKESLQHFGNWRGQGSCRGTSSSGGG